MLWKSWHAMFSAVRTRPKFRKGTSVLISKYLNSIIVFVVVFGLGMHVSLPMMTNQVMAQTEQSVAENDDQVSAEQESSQDEAVAKSEIIEMMIGSEDAPITVIEYASFTCPHCASFHRETFQPLKENYIDTGKVKFVFREVYFDKYGLWASLLARCGGRDAFFPMTDIFLTEQRQWSRAGDDLSVIRELRKLARVAGMEEAQIESCLQDRDKVRALVEWYKTNATADGVRSTPSFLIEGTMHENMSYAEFSELLDEKISD